MSDEAEKTVLEQSREIVSQLKQMRHDSKVNIENLAELWLLLDDKLKQKEHAQRVEELSGHQHAFHVAVEALISDYEMECNRMENEGC
ncbi:MAG: hypothetical protein KJ626_10305 [Verrucomicrobia bacterium]|nr:hypothetical protein [Verrucomicrobiota bacterium]